MQFQRIEAAIFGALTRLPTAAAALLVASIVSCLAHAGGRETAGNSQDANSKLPILHVDSSSGSDQNPGTRDRPWRSFAPLMSNRMKPGQRVQLHCRGIWRESLRLYAASLENGLQIEPYGDGCNGQRPRIVGADRFNGGWVKSGRVWSRNVAPDTPKIEALVVGSTRLHTARWPDANASPDRMLTGASADTKRARKIVIRPTDLRLLSAQDIKGAVIQLRTADWRIEGHVVQDIDVIEGSIRLQNETAYPVPSGSDFVLLDKMWMLDSPGEFFHDLERQRLFVILPDSDFQDLNQLNVEGSVRDVGIAVGRQSGLVIRGLDIANFRQTGVSLFDASQTLLTDLKVEHNLVKGVEVSGKSRTQSSVELPSVTIQDSTIVGSSLYGIDATAVAGIAIQRNKFSDIGMADGNDTGNSYAAISVGPSSLVQGNRISGAAYVGIRFDGTGSNRITENAIDGYCARIGDCAAIYTWNGPKGKDRKEGQAALVQGNILLDTAVRPPALQTRSGWMTSGIYLDDFSRGVVVRGNTIAYAPIGIHVHNGSDHLIESNKVWLSSQAAIWANMDQLDADYMRGNRYINNELVSISTVSSVWPAAPVPSGGQVVWYWRKLADVGRMKETYSQEFSGNRLVQIGGLPDTSVRLRGPGFDYFGPHIETHTGRGTSIDSVVILPAPVAPFTASLGADIINNGSFRSGLQSWGSWFNPKSTGGEVGHVAGTARCLDGCVKFKNASADDLFHSAGLKLQPGMPYMLAFDAEFGEGGELAAPYLSRNRAPWDRMTVPGSQAHLSPLAAQPGKQLSYRGVFQVVGDDDPARLNIKLASIGRPVILDNVSLKQILTYTVPQVTSYAAVANVERSGRFIDMTCNALQWPDNCAAIDINGEPVKLGPTPHRRAPMLLLRAK